MTLHYNYKYMYITTYLDADIPLNYDIIDQLVFLCLFYLAYDYNMNIEDRTVK